MADAIDLNSDLGERFGAWRLGDDEAVLDVVTSANVACGFHAGDPVTMLRTCERATSRGVTVGAHPGHRDLVGFGRRALAVEPDVLHAETLHQLGALGAAARVAGTRVAYVKPHGALYHQCAAEPALAESLVAAARAFDDGLVILGPAGSALLRAAREAGLPTAAEAFADRAYDADGGLVPRGRAGAVIDDPAAVGERAVALATTGRVRDVHGDEVAIAAESVCVHGDTPGAVGLARAVRRALEGAGVRIAPFAGGGR